MTWMNSRVRPSLRRRTVSTSRSSPGMKRSSPMRRRGPLGTSRMPVASTTSTPGWPSAKRPYQSSTSGVTTPSSVARHGTMAGTHVRSRATTETPRRSGENQRERAASSRVGQQTGRSAWRTRRFRDVSSLSVEGPIRARLYYPRFMGRAFEQVTLADAVGRLRAGMKVLIQPGCADPTALLGEIMRQADRLAPLTLMGGLRLDDYPFGAPEYAGRIRFATWHMSPRLAAAAARGDVDFVPARYFDTVTLFAAGGAWAPDVVLVHTAPPDRGGYLSLGVSVSYALPAARRTPLVIAQVNPRMPRTLGNAFLHRSQVDAWTPVDHPLLAYPPTPVGQVERDRKS